MHSMQKKRYIMQRLTVIRENMPKQKIIITGKVRHKSKRQLNFLSIHNLKCVCISQQHFHIWLLEHKAESNL
jgi:hypothetical protein